jgi:hypothetical protein
VIDIQKVALRFLLLPAMIFSVAAAQGVSADDQPPIFGQIYGTVVFTNRNGADTVHDAPSVVLIFSDKEGHRSFTLSRENGDFIELLEPGEYCISAFSRDGRRYLLDKRQRRCVTVEKGKNSRLDVVLSQPGP